MQLINQGLVKIPKMKFADPKPDHFEEHRTKNYATFKVNKPKFAKMISDS